MISPIFSLFGGCVTFTPPPGPSEKHAIRLPPESLTSRVGELALSHRESTSTARFSQRKIAMSVFIDPNFIILSARIEVFSSKNNSFEFEIMSLSSQKKGTRHTFST